MIWTSTGLTDLALVDPAAGLVCTAIDVGWPQTRAVASNRPLADGTDDTTAYIGARSVTMQFTIAAGTRTRAQNRALLAAFCHPGRRSVLKFDGAMLNPASGSTNRMMTLRCDQGSAPIDNRFHTAVAVTAIAPTGLIEAITATTVTVDPLAPAAGAPFDWEWPVSFPPASPTATVATSSGSMAAWPTIRIDGPCYAPVVACGSLLLSFPELAIDAGHYLAIDTSARTVLLDGTADRRSSLDPAVSTWWQIQPGANDLFFVPELSGPDAEATVTWRDAYFL